MADKPRNGGTWSDARYWQGVRSMLRRGFRYWNPIMQCKIAARRPNQSSNKRLKWEYYCIACRVWHPDKNIQVDHIIPVGTLKCDDDLAPFLKRLTPESGFQILCRECHQIKTNKERKILKEKQNVDG